MCRSLVRFQPLKTALRDAVSCIVSPPDLESPIAQDLGQPLGDGGLAGRLGLVPPQLDIHADPCVPVHYSAAADTKYYLSCVQAGR